MCNLERIVIKIGKFIDTPQDAIDYLHTSIQSDIEYHDYHAILEHIQDILYLKQNRNKQEYLKVYKQVFNTKAI